MTMGSSSHPTSDQAADRNRALGWSAIWRRAFAAVARPRPAPSPAGHDWHVAPGRWPPRDQ